MDAKAEFRLGQLIDKYEEAKKAGIPDDLVDRRALRRLPQPGDGERAPHQIHHGFPGRHQAPGQGRGGGAR